MNAEDTWGGLLALGAVVSMLVGGWLIVQAAVAVFSEPHCLRGGYPKVNVTWNFQRFCVKRQDQTDLVVPYDEVK